MEDYLIVFGDCVKATSNGCVEGYLVRFGSEKDPDLSPSRDFFTKKTNFGPHKTSLVFYDHGLDDRLKRRVLTDSASLELDEVGVWVEAQLSRRDQYEKAIYELARAGKLSWSSGTAQHLVERKKVGNAHEVLSWPLGLDASLTPTPAEFRNQVMTSLKSYQMSKAADLSNSAAFEWERAKFLLGGFEAFRQRAG